jgi:hypothetical protein
MRLGWGRHPSLLYGMVVDSHHGCPLKDACHGLRHLPSRAMERVELQHQRRGWAFLFQLTEHSNSKVRGMAPHPLLFIPQRKSKQSFETHARDHARCGRRLGLFHILTARHHTYCKWGPSPLVNSVGPPGMLGQPRMRAITPTTLKRVCSP